MRTTRRGNTLLVTMIAMGVLAAFVAGAIQFTGKNREAAGSQLRADEVAACADAARAFVLSRFRVFGVDPKTIQLDGFNKPADRLPDAPSATDQSRLITAHYGSNAPQVTITNVMSSAIGAAKNNLRDKTNTIGPNSLGATPYRVVVKCVAGSSNREQEIEFLFRYGL